MYGVHIDLLYYYCVQSTFIFTVDGFHTYVSYYYSIQMVFFIMVSLQSTKCLFSADTITVYRLYNDLVLLVY